MIDSMIYLMVVGDASIGGAIGTRLYPTQIPQNAARPCVAYQKIAVYDRELAHSGSGHVATAVYRFSVYAATMIEAKQIAAEIVSLFHGYSGTSGAEEILVARASGETDLFDPDLGDFHVAVDVDITHRE